MLYILRLSISEHMAAILPSTSGRAVDQPSCASGIALGCCDLLQLHQTMPQRLPPSLASVT